MSDWRKVIEEGTEYWINDNLGNIVRTEVGTYVSIIPKAVKLGPFNDLTQAQQALENNKEALDEWLDQYNHNIMMMVEDVGR